MQFLRIIFIYNYLEPTRMLVILILHYLQTKRAINTPYFMSRVKRGSRHAAHTAHKALRWRGKQLL